MHLRSQNIGVVYLPHSLLHGFHFLYGVLEGLSVKGGEELHSVTQPLCGDAHLMQFGDVGGIANEPLPYEEIRHSRGNDHLGVRLDRIRGVDAIDHSLL